MKTICTIIAVLMLSAVESIAQVSHPGMPRSMQASLAPVSDYGIVAPPAVSKVSGLTHNGLVPFAKVIGADMPVMEGSQADTLASGMLYRMGIASEGAYSLGLCFSGLHLEQGSELYVYGSDAAFIIGAVDAMEVAADSTLRTAQIPGDSITVELYVPFGVDQKPFSISKVYYDFRDFFSDVHAISKSRMEPNVCSIEVDVNCYQGQDYQVIKHSVLRYSFEDSDYLCYCTGSLVNSLRCDTLPLVLTAAHCVCSEEEAQSVVFYFDYENTSCGGSRLASYQSLSGSSLVATSMRKPKVDKYGTTSAREYAQRDFTLLRINRPIPAGYSPYFAGISLDTVNAINSVVCIHHPDGKSKKISACFQKVYEDCYPNEDDPETNYLPFNHWHVPVWAYGTTEGGSSGAPLLNQNQSVIGILSGGYASCQSPRNDFFQMVSKAWQGSEWPDYQLRHWLSPDFDAKEIPPFDPYYVASRIPKSYISGSLNADTTQIHLEWQLMPMPGGRVDSSYHGFPINKYLLYCNGQLVREIDDPGLSSCDFDISPDARYEFYILNSYGDVVSDRGNTLFIDPYYGRRITSVSDIDLSETGQSVLAYPNPAHGSVSLVSDADCDAVRIDIVDNAGRLCRSYAPDAIRTAEPLSIDILGLAPATYIIKVYSHDRCLSSQKLVVY